MYNPDAHHRHSIRIKEYDYSQEGMYFITICTKDRECMLAKKSNNKMILNEYGKIVEKCILKIPIIYKNVYVKNYVIMPNHIHMIIEIENVGVAYYATQNIQEMDIWQKSKMLIPKIIQQFKTATIKKTKILGLHGMQPLQWQRNYYEHIIRNEKEYYKIYEYIEYNVLNWTKDTNYL